MNALTFTTPQLILLYGWCETAEESKGSEAKIAQNSKQWEQCASLLEELKNCRAILTMLAVELRTRDEMPPVRSKPPSIN